MAVLVTDGAKRCLEATVPAHSSSCRYGTPRRHESRYGNCDNHRDLRSLNPCADSATTGEARWFSYYDQHSDLCQHRRWKQPIALSQEIIAHRAVVAALAVALGIEDIVPMSQRGSMVSGEILILKRCHHYQLSAVANVRILCEVNRVCATVSVIEERSTTGNELRVGCADPTSTQNNAIGSRDSLNDKAQQGGDNDYKPFISFLLKKLRHPQYG